jgi:hypothetical protein
MVDLDVVLRYHEDFSKTIQGVLPVSSVLHIKLGI